MAAHPALLHTLPHNGTARLPAAPRRCPLSPQDVSKHGGTCYYYDHGLLGKPDRAPLLLSASEHLVEHNAAAGGDRLRSGPQGLQQYRTQRQQDAEARQQHACFSVEQDRGGAVEEVDMAPAAP